jgi:lysozyme family protein
MTSDERQTIYHDEYWVPSKVESLLSQPLANSVFDMAFNHWIVVATECLQRACADCGKSVTVDGKFGPVTLATADSCDEVSIVNAYAEERKAVYREDAQNHPQETEFLDGWLSRAESFKLPVP